MNRQWSDKDHDDDVLVYISLGKVLASIFTFIDVPCISILGGICIDGDDPPCEELWKIYVSITLLIPVNKIRGFLFHPLLVRLLLPFHNWSF